MPVVTVVGAAGLGSQTLEETRVECEAGERLLDVLDRAGVSVPRPCGGRGTCGKCRVEVLGEGGGLGEADSAELALLSSEDIAHGVRLACLARVLGDATVRVARQGAFVPDPRGLTAVAARPGEGAEPGGWDVPAPQGFQPGRPGYGVAFDVGTTTVAGVLVRLATGEVLAQDTRLNAQAPFGADVLTRISFECDRGEEGVAQLQQAAVGCLNELVAGLCMRAGVGVGDVVELVVAANCVMTHMLLGVDARPLGRAPYTPAFTEARRLPACEAGLAAGEGATLYCLPQVGAYLGGDVVGGAYACGMHEAGPTALLADLGTNGELVLRYGGRLLSTSCAMGPALEGMGIACGVRAGRGAVDDVRITPRGVSFTTIGSEAPTGLCGSGVLAAVRELVRCGAVGVAGRLVDPAALEQGDVRCACISQEGSSRVFVVSKRPRVMLTQGDVRQVQLAKGALLAGVTALLQAAGVEAGEVERVFVAGSFGAHLEPSCLLETGVFPLEFEGRLSYVGNSSLASAYLALLSPEVRRQIEGLATSMEYLDLTHSPGFDRLFARCTRFAARG